MEHSFESKPRVCFEVEKVIGVSNAGNVRSYQVRYAPVWVNSLHLVGCEHLIEQFIEQQQEDEQQQKQQQQQQQQQSEMDYPVVVLPSDSNEVSQYPDMGNFQNVSENYRVPEFNKTLNFQNNDSLPEMLDTEQSANSELESSITNFSQESIRVDGEDYTIVVGNSVVPPPVRETKSDTEISVGVYDIDISTVKVEEEDMHCPPNNKELKFDPQKKTDEKRSYRNQGTRASFLEMHDDSLADLKSIQTNILETHNPKNLDSQKTEPSNNTSSSSRDNLIGLVDAGGGKTLYSCMQCGKTSLQKREMQIHVRSHTGQKPYECEICKKSFSVKCSLKRHRRLHTGEKPFSCDKCDKRFTFHNQLKRHSVVHSEEIDVP